MGVDRMLATGAGVREGTGVLEVGSVVAAIVSGWGGMGSSDAGVGSELQAARIRMQIIELAILTPRRKGAKA